MACLNPQFLPKDGRLRNITFMLYEDSAPIDWRDRLDKLHIQYLYMFHDKDVNGTEHKKDHYHIVLLFEGKKSTTQIDAIVSDIGGANGAWEVVGSARAMARYLCHLDNPDKAPYDPADVVAHGIDYDELIALPKDKYTAISEMIDYCEEHNIISFYELLLYARINNYSWFHALCDNSTIIIKEYLKSKQWTQEREQRQSDTTLVIDTNTGEVKR